MRRKKIYRFFDRYLGIPIVIFLALLTKKKRRLPVQNIRHILFIKLAAIGDAILLVPTIRKLKNSYPGCTIDFICSDVNKVFVERIPYIDRVINCKVYDLIKNPAYLYSFIKHLRQKKYELVIDAGQWERINTILTIFARKDYSIGFKTKHQVKHIINDAVVGHIPDRHEVENFLDLLIPVGIVPVSSKVNFDDTQLEFFLKEEERAFRDNFWNKHNLSSRRVICIQPGCGHNGKAKEWQIEKYIRLAHMIKLRFDNLMVLITGTDSEAELCAKLHEGISDFSMNICGKFTLFQDAALIERSELIICSNTGILHIAACVDTKSIALHGPHNHLKWGAYSSKSIVIRSDKFCSPCLYLGHDFGCRKPTCMYHISVDEVYSEAVKSLQQIIFSEAI